MVYNKIKIRTVVNNIVNNIVQEFGCIFIFLFFASELQIEFNIFNKTSTRLPESMSVMFTPSEQYGFSWMLSKLGQQIDPKSVVENGSQYQHGMFFPNCGIPHANFNCVFSFI